MAGQAVADFLDAYRNAPTLEEAEQALRALEGSQEPADGLAIGDLYDELAQLAADEDDFGLAVRAQARALELGCQMPTIGREMLGWYLMKDGRRPAGEAEFDALRRELGDEPELLITLGNARFDAGHEMDALSAIQMFFKEHGVPHFHARCAGQMAVFTIESFERIRGELPLRAERLVREWAGLHRDELLRNWESARAGRPLAPIEPLA